MLRDPLKQKHMKKIIVIVLALTLNTSFSQEELVKFENHLKSSSLSINDAIPIVNNYTKEISLIFTDSKQVYGYLLDHNFKVTKNFISDKRSRKYKTIIGSTILDKNYILYLANNKRNKFVSVRFSYENDESKITELSLDLDNEKFIQTAEYKNKLYLMTVNNRSSVLNIYAFSDESNYKKKEIDLSQYFDENDSFYDLLTVSKNGSFKKVVDINKIEDSNPNTIEITSEVTKMYQHDSKIIFSFDDFEDFTKVVTLNLDNFKYEVIEFDKPFNDVKSKSTNSFINGNQIYMIASTKEKLNFSIYNFETGILIKEYNTNVDEDIQFKNTPLIQVGGMYDNYRELEKTQKFLRKVTNGDIGVSVFKHRNTYQISIGGKQEIRTNGGMMMGMGGMGLPIANFGAMTVFFNPTMYAYNSYIHTKSIQFKGLFDENLNHIEGEIEKNGFDKIKEYEDENKKPPNGKSIFRYKDYYILGTFSRWPSKEYTLRRFTN